MTKPCAGGLHVYSYDGLHFGWMGSASSTRCVRILRVLYIRWPAVRIPYTYPEHVAEEALGDVLDGAVGADGHQPPQRPGVGGRQQLRHLRDAAPRCQRAVVLRALARVRVAQRHLPDADAAAAAVQLPGQVVRHEPAVAGADHVHGAAGAEAREVAARAAAAREERGEGAGLEGVGAGGRARGGGPEEEERGHHQVEVAGQRARLRRPLPRRVRAEPVDQHHHRPRRLLLLRGRGGLEEGGVGPEVDGGVVGVDGGGGGAEARRGEHAAEHRVEQGHHAEPHGCPSVSSSCFSLSLNGQHALPLSFVLAAGPSRALLVLLRFSMAGGAFCWITSTSVC
jgi:hypothetical protein